MLAAARSRFPGIDVRAADAADLPLGDRQAHGYRADKVYHILPESQQKVFVKYAKEKVSIDHYYSISGGMEEAKDNQKRAKMGYAVYIAPSENMPCTPNGGVCNRVIGNTLTCGQIAAFVQKSGDFDKRVGGIFN